MLRNSLFFFRSTGCVVLTEPKTLSFHCTHTGGCSGLFLLISASWWPQPALWGQPGNQVGFTPHLFTGFPSRRRRGAGVLPSSASLPGSFLLWPRLVPGARQANLQPQQNAKYRCARGAARATWGAAG